ncbi:hypothetical protein ACP0HM_36240 [Escherichia coli]
MMAGLRRTITSLKNALRMVSLGRKNYLFFGSDHGGERGALLYSPDRDVQK